MYVVTIQRERMQYVARDKDGNKRAWGDVGGLEVSRPEDIAEYLFHKEEIGSVKVDGSNSNPAIIVEILES